MQTGMNHTATVITRSDKERKGFPENLLNISPPINEPRRNPKEFDVNIRPAVQIFTPVFFARVGSAGPMEAAISPTAKRLQ